MRRRKAWLALAIIVLPLFAVLLGASAAGGAEPSPSSKGTQSALICSSGSTSASTTTDNLLPVNRWSGAIGDEHDRLPGGLLSSISDAPDEIDRSMFVGGMTSIAAAEWQLGVASSEAASQFCFATTVGQDANSLAATLGNAIGNSGILAILAVVALVAAAWRASRGRENPVREIAKFAIVVAIFVAVVTAATNSTSTDTLPLSPAWLVQTAYNAVSNVASGPASAISSAANSTVNGTTQGTIAKSDPLSCYWYTQELVDQYQSAYTATNSYGYVVPTSLNALWEQAAIPAYTSEQFGSNNDFGPLIYCHLLEDQAGTDPATQMSIAKASGTLSGDTNLATYGTTQASALAWNGAITNDQEDESMVAWAACQSPGKGSDGSGFTPSEWDASTGDSVTSAWTTVTNQNAQSMGNADTTVSGDDCQVFWSAYAPASGGQYGDAYSSGPFASPSAAPWGGQLSNPDYSVFNQGDDPTTIAKETNSAGTSGQQIADFLNNLHGTSNASASATSFIFLLSSTVVMVVFLVMSLAVIVAKLALLLSMMLLPAMLILALLPGGASGKFAAYAKHLFGLVLFSTCAGLLLSFIAIITGLISDIGSSAFGQGSLFSLMWVAFAPVSAIFMVHIFFKKVLKAPSPFKPTSAMSYASALSGFGGGLAGADLFSHMKNRGGQAVSAARGRMSGKQEKGRGSRARGVHSMGASGSGATSDVAAAAGGAGAGVATGAVSQSMFGKRQRRENVALQEQHNADQYVRSERVLAATKRVEQLKGSLLNPSATRDAVTEATKTRVKDSLQRTKDRIRHEDASGNAHKIQGSLLTAGAAAASIGRGVRKVPKIAKYGALGASAVVAGSFGAPVLAAAGGLYGVHKLRQHHRGAPQRAQQRLVSYREHKDQQQKAVNAARALQEAHHSALEENDTRSENERTRALEAEAEAKAARERATLEREERLRAWRNGEVGPQGPARGGPVGPGR